MTAPNSELSAELTGRNLSLCSKSLLVRPTPTHPTHPYPHASWDLLRSQDSLQELSSGSHFWRVLSVHYCYHWLISCLTLPGPWDLADFPPPHRSLEGLGDVSPAAIFWIYQVLISSQVYAHEFCLGKPCIFIYFKSLLVLNVISSH